MQCFPWQQTQWQQIQKSRQNNRMPHALLLTGPKGLGKHDFAYALAKNLFCELPSMSESCECRQCQLFTAGTHPDFFVVTPEEDSKSIKVDQIRELITSVNQTAHYNGYQVVIIEPAEALNIAAANALLKTLEEPQGKVILLLISQQQSLLSATIRSRCQQIIFKTPQLAVAKSWLSQQLTPDVDVELLLKYTEGAPLAALALARGEGIKLREQLWQQMQQVVTGEVNPITVAAQYAKEDIVTCIDNMIGIIQDMLRSGRTQKISVRRLFGFYDLLCSRKNLLQHHNGINAQMMLEEILINWTMLRG